jgi:hypothetical protein
MKIQISPASNVVSIDGEARQIDTSKLNQSVLSVSFDDAKKQGVEHLNNGEVNVITTLAAYQTAVDAWHAWQPAQPPEPAAAPVTPVPVI